MSHTIQNLEKWTPNELISEMRLAGWFPAPAVGVWIHSGHTVNLNDTMRDGREYWHQLAERQQTPPISEAPF